MKSDTHITSLISIMKTDRIISTAAFLLWIVCGFDANAQEPGGVEPGGITSLEDVLAEVPKELLLSVRSGARKEASATEATGLLRRQVEGRIATIKLKVDRFDKYRRKNETEDRYRIKAEDERLRGSVTNFRAFLWVHLSPTESAKMANVKKGAEITVNGKVSLASITAKNNPELHVDLADATIK